MPVAYPHVAERLFGHAHAIEPFALRAIVEGPIGRRVLAGERLEVKQDKKSRKLRRDRMSALADAEMVRSNDGMVEYALTDEGVAIVPIAGALSRRFDWLAAACGWTTYDALDASLDAAMKDFRVRGVMLDVDSPGGEAAGMLDIADKILALRDVKPVWAVANTFAASAAYALAGSASRLVLPRLGQVGSIGCVIVHVDQSAQDEAMGLNYTAIYSGARKIDGWAHAPLSGAAKDSFQADADHCRGAFADLVGRQGRMSAKAALDTEAEVFSDTDAVKIKLADAVMTFDEALAEFTESVSRNSSTPMAAHAANHGDRDMSLKEQLKSNTSPAAVVAGQQPAPIEAVAAAAAEGGAPAAAAAALPEVAAAGKPAAGEKCQTCGQTMPDDNDLDAAAAASAVDAGYTVEMATQTMDLCAIAKVSIGDAKAFVAAKTPVEGVRSALAKRAADTVNATAVDGTAKPAGGAAEASVAATWDQVVAEQNAKLQQPNKR